MYIQILIYNIIMLVHWNSFGYMYTTFLLKELKVLHRYYLWNPHNILFKQRNQKGLYRFFFEEQSFK